MPAVGASPVTAPSRWKYVSPVSGYSVFCGLDVGKQAHHACALDLGGRRLIDAELPQDEARLRQLLERLQARAAVLVVVDQPNTIGALPVAVARSMMHRVAGVGLDPVTGRLLQRGRSHDLAADPGRRQRPIQPEPGRRKPPPPGPVDPPPRTGCARVTGELDWDSSARDAIDRRCRDRSGGHVEPHPRSVNTGASSATVGAAEQAAPARQPTNMCERGPGPQPRR